MRDHFDNAIPSDRHAVVVLSEVIVETPDPGLTTVVSRGIYLFTNKKSAAKFAKDINGAALDETAHIFTRNIGD